MNVIKLPQGVTSDPPGVSGRPLQLPYAQIFCTCRPSSRRHARSAQHGCSARGWGTARGLGRGRQLHRQPVVMQAASAAAPPQVTALADIDLVPMLNTEGLIQPKMPESTEAAVFAIYNEAKQLQYVGFSRDLYNSLRTVFSRRPEKAYFYKFLALDQVDQEAMLATRTAWFEECGGPPIGNKLALERTAWQQPVSAGAISDRGKQAAAEETVRSLMTKIQGRGCKEDFQPNPSLLQNGQVDFMPAKAMSAEELEEQRLRMAEVAKRKRSVLFQMDDKTAQYELYFSLNFKTNGGMMFDITVTYDSKETRHRIIVGREYYEGSGFEPETVIEMLVTFLLQKKVPRQTEGMLLSNQFPINYFSVSEVEQWYPDLADLWSETEHGLPDAGKFWRFNKIHDYGWKGEDPDALSAQFQLIEPAGTA